MRKTIRPVWLVVLAALLAACSLGSSGDGTPVPGALQRPDNAIDVFITYSPESRCYLPQVIANFNQAYASGTDPLTSQALPGGTQPIFVTDMTNGSGASAGNVRVGIVNAIIAPNNQNVVRPTIWAPSVSHWLVLANEDSGRDLFDLASIQPTALAPVVMAIWESRLQAIRSTVGHDEVGWEELLQVLHSPNGWQDFGISGRRTVFYGHTDPFISSTALSTLIAEFYASARAHGFTGRELSLEQVNDPVVQQGVRDIEQLIRHYAPRTTEFVEYIARGPEYLDFVALEENDVIGINRGQTERGQPPESLVALYPKEGTFWHEHPFGIVNADWVTPEQREAARRFTQYVLSVPVQQSIMECNFRPVNPDVELAFPFVEENGVTVEGPTTILDVPDAEVILAVQQSWAFVKKQADIMLLIDVSGSMQEEDKIGQAIQAAEAFVNEVDPGNRIGLAVFSDNVRLLVPLGSYETVQDDVLNQIRNLRADGGTELYAAVTQTVDTLNKVEDADRIRAVVLLSDGQDTGDEGVTLNDAVTAITASSGELNPVIVVPVAYGANADVSTLNSIARASATSVQSGDPQNILNVLQIISSYF